MAVGNSSVQNQKSNRKLWAILGLLGLLLAGLLLVYSLLTRPPAINEGGKKSGGYTVLFSIYGFEGDRLNKPTGVTVDAAGDIYVADSDKHRVVVFDSAGNFKTKFGKYGQGKYEIQYPSSVAVGENGNIFVVSKPLNKVVIYNQKFKPIYEIGIDRPLIAVTNGKKLYVTTPRGVLWGDLKGNPSGGFGQRGTKPGYFDFPTGLVMDDKDNFYIADSLNYRLQAVAKDGKSIWAVGTPASVSKTGELRDSNRKFGLPTSVAMDEQGSLYMMDALNGEIYMFTKKGKGLGKVGEWGHNEGQFYYPEGMAYAGNRVFVVADKFNDRVQVIRIPNPVPTIADQAIAYGLPLLALIPLALIILWALRRRKNRFAADNSFLERAVSEGMAASIALAFGEFYVTKETYEAFRDVEEDEVRLGDVIKVGVYETEKANEITTEYGLEDSPAATLAMALKLHGKVTVFSEDEELANAAEKNKLNPMTYDMLLELLATDETQEAEIEEPVSP